jgi:hypothetical protein
MQAPLNPLPSLLLGRLLLLLRLLLWGGSLPLGWSWCMRHSCDNNVIVTFILTAAA